MDTVIGDMGANSLRSFVPELIQRKGWDTKRFVATCMLSGLGQDTAYRLARGDTNFTTDTLYKVAEILGASTLTDLIGIERAR